MAQYYQCQRCKTVYRDTECQCPETGAELCQKCYRKWGEHMAYEMEPCDPPEMQQTPAEGA